MKHLLKYVNGTQDLVLELGSSEFGVENEVTVLADANWAEGPSRRSTSGGTIYFRGVMLMSYSRTQPVVALSTCEAELLAVSTATSEGLFVVHILSEIGIIASLRIMSDSSAARAVVQRRGPGRMKHLQIRHLWLQEGFRRGDFELSVINSDVNIADALTKHFAGGRHALLRGLLGLRAEDA